MRQNFARFYSCKGFKNFSCPTTFFRNKGNWIHPPPRINIVHSASLVLRTTLWGLIPCLYRWENRLREVTSFPEDKDTASGGLGFEPRSFLVQSICYNASTASKIQARKKKKRVKFRLEKSEAFILYFFSSTWSFFQHVFLKRRRLEADELHFLTLELERSWTHPFNICLHSSVIATYKSSRRVGTIVGCLANLPSTQRLAPGNTAGCCWGGWSQTTGATGVHSLSLA